jgi:hypothetical protein
MNTSVRRLVLLVSLLLISAIFLAACGTPSAEQMAATAVVATVEQKQANVDTVFTGLIDAVNVALEKAGDLPSQEAKAELLIADLEEINSRVNAAIEQEGDDQIQAFQDISQNVDALISGVNEAADSATGEYQVALQALATQLETTQGALQETIVDVLGGTPMPEVMESEAEEAMETPEAEVEEAMETPEAEEEAEAEATPTP